MIHATTPGLSLTARLPRGAAAQRGWEWKNKVKTTWYEGED